MKAAKKTPAKKIRAAIVVADFYPDIADAMLSRCAAVLREANADISVLRVSGALDIPHALLSHCESEAKKKRRPDLMVALGCVVRGETFHFEVVARTSADGVLQAQLQSGVPIANGVLTVETKAQAKARLSKGADAARAALRSAALRAEKLQ